MNIDIPDVHTYSTTEIHPEGIPSISPISNSISGGVSCGILVYTAFILLFLYAIWKEATEGDDCYTRAIPKDTNQIGTLLRKIGICTKYEDNVVRWRKAYIIAFVGCIVIFLVLGRRIPTPRELVLTTFVLLVVAYGCSIVDMRYHRQVQAHVHKGISLIKQRLNII